MTLHLSRAAADDRRGTGLGGRMLAELEQAAAERGVRRVFVTCTSARTCERRPD